MFSSARRPGNFQVDVDPVDNFGLFSTGVRARLPVVSDCATGAIGPVIFESMFSSARLPVVSDCAAGATRAVIFESMFSSARPRVRFRLCCRRAAPLNYFFTRMCAASWLFSMHSYSSTRVLGGRRNSAPVVQGFVNTFGSVTVAA